MSNGNNNGPDDKRSTRRDSDNDFGDAVSRLEKAVQELVTTAKDETFDKAGGVELIGFGCIGHSAMLCGRFTGASIAGLEFAHRTIGE